MATFKDDNERYESWLRTQCDVVEADLENKHEKMRESAFVFLRATYFRWALTIETICPELKTAPAVLSVGDVHLENFGTWRDSEGRSVWGINDFDEATVIPYAYDLVRLAASVRLAPGTTVANQDAAKAIEAGYRRGLAHPRPTLLDEQETWMRPLVACTDEDRRKFWGKVDALVTVVVPQDVASALARSLPAEASIERIAKRSVGGGSLGRPRYVAIADWRGGRILREAKALVASAWDWAHQKSEPDIHFLELATGKYRSPDPSLMTQDRFIFRQLAADSRKVELGGKAATLVGPLLEAMGADLGAIHAAYPPGATAILQHLDKQPSDWLHKAAKRAAAAVQTDYDSWI
jgi:hypothetical protein